MTVLRLVHPPSNVETIELLECMLALAITGEVRDVSATYTRNGEEQMAFSGRYRSHPAEAHRAAFEKCVVLSKLRKKRGD